MGQLSATEALENSQDFVLHPRSEDFLTSLPRRGETEIVSPTDPEPTTPRYQFHFQPVRVLSPSFQTFLSECSFFKFTVPESTTITSLMVTGFSQPRTLGSRVSESSSFFDNAITAGSAVELQY
jgi:hypothetical protein